MNKNDLLNLIDNYHNFYNEELVFIHQIRDFILQNEDFDKRTNQKGHITASVWVVDETKNNAILIHHKKLDKWLQMGGHIENTDISIFDAAIREAKEESGLNTFKVLSYYIFDIDIHQIPQKNHEPNHLHYDIRVLLEAPFQANFIGQKEEIKSIKWFPIIDLLEAENTSIRRMAQKTLKIAKN